MSTITKMERREQEREAHRTRHPLKPSKWQAVAQAVYGGGMFDHLKRQQFDSAGDSLFTFIMSELEDCGDFAEALRLMEQARDDLDGVITALLRKG